MKILDENFNVVAEVQTQRPRCAKTTLFRVIRRIGDAPKPKMIIGMDIISNGDFAFTNKDGKASSLSDSRQKGMLISR